MYSWPPIKIWTIWRYVFLKFYLVNYQPKAPCKQILLLRLMESPKKLRLVLNRITIISNLWHFFNPFGLYFWKLKNNSFMDNSSVNDDTLVNDASLFFFYIRNHIWLIFYIINWYINWSLIVHKVRVFFLFKNVQQLFVWSSNLRWICHILMVCLSITFIKNSREKKKS